MVDTKAPEKPHFLQPVLPGHTKDFLIPIAFFKYLNGRKCEQALLRSSRGGEPWPVKINGRRILEGWEEFAAHHDLHVGDFVVFRYEGDFVFDVTVFGPNTWEKEYDAINDELMEACREPVEVETVNGASNAHIAENQVVRKKCNGSYASKAKPTSFVGTIKPSYLKHLFLPLWFSRFNGLGSDCSEMILRDESGKLWPIKLSHRQRDQRASANWRSFIKANGVAEGEKFMLEVIEKGRIPVLLFRRLNVGKNFMKRKKVLERNGCSASTEKSTCFVGTMRPSYACKLYLPRRFTLSNGLGKGCSKMTVIDESRKLWPVRLTHRDNDPRAFACWKAFKDAHGLTEGEQFTLKAIEKGRKPTLQFHRLNKSKKVMKPESKLKIYRPVATSIAGQSPSPHFLGIIRVSELYKTRILVPKEFTVTNELTNKQGKMVIRYSTSDSWVVVLRNHKHHRLYVGSGRRTLVIQNVLKVGDGYEMELIRETEEFTMQTYSWS